MSELQLVPGLLNDTTKIPTPPPLEGVTIVYCVSNKVFSILFGSEKSAKAFMMKYATGSNGLEVRALQVFD
jgi:hypothetical protein